MPELWLISAPGDESRQETFDKLNAATKPYGLSINHKFHVPDLRIGTLDTLFFLTDQLVKLDVYAESITKKLVSCMEEIVGNKKDMLSENLRINNVDAKTFVKSFIWDSAKYPVRQSLPCIVEIIKKKLQTSETELKLKTNEYNNLKTCLQNLERKRTGSLLIRPLNDLVKREHFIMDSRFLTTILIVMPNARKCYWENSYETLSPMIVPRSSEKIFEDIDYSLYNVTLFKKFVDVFKTKAHEEKFFIRDFEFSENEIAADKNAYSKLKTEKNRHCTLFFQWLSANFSECFAAYIHIKALRVFVESVLRYGLPINFQAIVIEPKSSKRLREVLNILYRHLDCGFALACSDDIPSGLRLLKEWWMLWQTLESEFTLKKFEMAMAKV